MVRDSIRSVSFRSLSHFTSKEYKWRSGTLVLGNQRKDLGDKRNDLDDQRKDLNEFKAATPQRVKQTGWAKPKQLPADNNAFSNIRKKAAI